MRLPQTLSRRGFVASAGLAWAASYLAPRAAVAADADEPTVLAAAKADEKVIPFLDGKALKRAIYVKGRLVNFVV